jgi:hypothetical protein
MDKEERLLRYLEEIAAVLDSCSDMLQEWGDYADDYFKKKHCFDADVAYIKSHAARVKAVANGTDLLSEYD